MIRCFKPPVRNGHNRRQNLVFIRIPDLHDMSVGYAVSQSEDVSPCRQHLTGDFHRIVEGDDGLLVPLIRSSARRKCGPQQNNSDQHGAQSYCGSSQSFHATTSWFWIDWAGWYGRNCCRTGKARIAKSSRPGTAGEHSVAAQNRAGSAETTNSRNTVEISQPVRSSLTSASPVGCARG